MKEDLEWLKKNRELIYLQILFLLGIIYGALKLTWLHFDKSLHFVGDGTHLLITANQLANLKNLDITTFLLVREMYPNLYHNLAALAAFVLGRPETGAAVVNLFFVFLTMAGTYLLARELWNPDTAFLSAMLVPAFPRLNCYATSDNLEIALGAFVVLSMLALIKSRAFTHRGWTFAFFALSALGMLIKWAFVFFLAVPFLMVIIPELKKVLKDETTRRQGVVLIISALLFYPVLIGITGFLPLDTEGYPSFDSFIVFYFIIVALMLTALIVHMLKSRTGDFVKNTIGGLLLFFMMISHYYLFNIRSLAAIYLGRFWGGRAKHEATLTLYNFFIKYFTVEFLGVHLLILFLAGLIAYFIYKGQRSSDKNLLLASVLSAVVLLALQPVYFSRYFIPLAGIMAPLMTFWIIPVKPALLRYAVILPYAALWILTWSGFAVVPHPHANLGPIEISRPNPEDWELDAAMDRIHKHWRINNQKSRGYLVVVYNDLDPDYYSPLVLNFFIKKSLEPGQEVYLLTQNVSFSQETEKGKARPFAYYISEKPDSGSDLPADKDSDIDMNWDSIHPDCIYFFRSRIPFVDRNLPTEAIELVRPVVSRERLTKNPVNMLDTYIIGNRGLGEISCMRLR